MIHSKTSNRCAGSKRCKIFNLLARKKTSDYAAFKINIGNDECYAPTSKWQQFEKKNQQICCTQKKISKE